MNTSLVWPCSVVTRSAGMSSEALPSSRGGAGAPTAAAAAACTPGAMRSSQGGLVLEEGLYHRHARDQPCM
jgi:hypothetical protein